jgi:hypothetical protein
MLKFATQCRFFCRCDVLLSLVAVALYAYSFQCLCGAPNCRGWLGKTPQEFDLENLGSEAAHAKKNSVQRKKHAAKPHAKPKMAPLQTTDKPHASRAPSISGGQKRLLDLDEFGLSPTQKRLQIQAMAKLQLQFSQQIPNSADIGSTVAPAALTARKRSLDVDEFGLTAAQRELQLQAIAKLQMQSS